MWQINDLGMCIKYPHQNKEQSNGMQVVYLRHINDDISEYANNAAGKLLDTFKLIIKSN